MAHRPLHSFTQDKQNPGLVAGRAQFLAEDGHTIKLSDFAGHALAFTFIFNSVHCRIFPHESALQWGPGLVA